MFKRVFCLFAVLSILVFVSIPAFATGTMPGGSIGGLPVGLNLQLDVVDFANFVRDDFRWCENTVRHWLDEDVCPYAPTSGGNHSFVPRRTMVDGQIGKYYVCEYCGKAYGDALEEAYDEYVQTLPAAKQVNSSGAFLWKPAPDDCFADGFQGMCYFWYEGNGSCVSLNDGRYSAYGGTCVVSAGSSISLGGVSTSGRFRFYINSIQVPYDGWYKSANSGLGLRSIDGFYGAGLSFSGPYVSDITGGFALIPWPEYWVTPLEELAGLSGDARVSGGSVSDSGTGLYGYVQDGQLYQSTVGTIYNETTNIYQNPVTGETKDVSNWTYDYSDRSYTLTTDDGDTVTITYGDTNVTINDGGTTYNVYYLTEHDESIPEHYYTSSVTLAPTCTGTGVRTYTCDDCGDTYTEIIPATGHSYQSAVTMSPSCINTGVRTFTCSVCGDVYTVSIPSTGHTWQVLQSVPTVYDEDGQLVTEGYTLYQCATCGYQYKITADSGGASLPSPGGGGTSTDTDSSLVELDPHVGRGFLATIAHGLTEDLPEVLKAASSWFTEFPAFYGNFTVFLKDGIAGCLPDIPRKTMGVGLSMVTFIGIVKKIIGR